MQLFVFLSFQEQRGSEERRRRGFSVALNIFLYCEKCSMFMCLHASQGGEMNNRGLVIGSIRRRCSFLFLLVAPTSSSSQIQTNASTHPSLILDARFDVFFWAVFISPRLTVMRLGEVKSGLQPQTAAGGSAHDWLRLLLLSLGDDEREAWLWANGFARFYWKSFGWWEDERLPGRMSPRAAQRRAGGALCWRLRLMLLSLCHVR